MRRLIATCVLSLALLPAAHAQSSAHSTTADLLTLAEALRTLREPLVTDRVPDYSPAAVTRWQKGLATLRARHTTFDTRTWPVADRVDHVLVGTQLNAFDFDLRVLRPWQRDPGHWVDMIARTPYVATPVSATDRARVTAELRAVPRLLAEARTRLDRPSAELAGIALFHLEQSDGVNQGEPRRDPPPAGVIGWYQDLREREIERARTLLAIERNRNRNLPELVPVTNADEHEKRTRESESLIRSFTAREQLLTIPADIPEKYETDAFFINRDAWGGYRHFWEEITYRDPLNNHIHASIPGHRLDGTLQRRNPRPVRRMVSDGTRAEGWGFYIEEMYLQAGLLNDRPRTRELFYIAQLKRAARVHAEQLMQTGAFSLAQAIDYLVAEVPLMDDNLARYDLAIYLRRPAYGMNHTIGKAQMKKLVSDRSRQLGSRFVLGAFHDEFLTKGMIPISLIRWEMTGQDDEMRALGVIK